MSVLTAALFYNMELISEKSGNGNNANFLCGLSRSGNINARLLACLTNGSNFIVEVAAGMLYKGDSKDSGSSRAEVNGGQTRCCNFKLIGSTLLQTEVGIGVGNNGISRSTRRNGYNTNLLCRLIGGRHVKSCLLARLDRLR